MWVAPRPRPPTLYTGGTSVPGPRALPGKRCKLSHHGGATRCAFGWQAAQPLSSTTCPGPARGRSRAHYPLLFDRARLKPALNSVTHVPALAGRTTIAISCNKSQGTLRPLSLDKHDPHPTPRFARQPPTGRPDRVSHTAARPCSQRSQRSRPRHRPAPSSQALEEPHVVVQRFLVPDLAQRPALHPVLGRPHLQVVCAGHGHAVGARVVHHQAVAGVGCRQLTVLAKEVCRLAHRAHLQGAAVGVVVVGVCGCVGVVVWWCGCGCGCGRGRGLDGHPSVSQRTASSVEQQGWATADGRPAGHLLQARANGGRASSPQALLLTTSKTCLAPEQGAVSSMCW